MIIELVIMRNNVHVGSVVVYVSVNQEPRVCLPLTYIQNRHRLFGVLSILLVIVLDLIAYDNAYSTL